MLKVYVLGPVSHSNLLTGDFHGRSSWRQGSTAPQGILELNHAPTCKQVCTTCKLLAPALAANEVCSWLWFEDFCQILEREASDKPLQSTHVVVGPFDLLEQMRADLCSNQFCLWQTNAPVLRPSQSAGTVGYASTAGSSNSSSGVQLRCASQVWVHRWVSYRGS